MAVTFCVQVAKKKNCTVFDLIFFNAKIYPELAASSRLKTGTQLQVIYAILLTVV